MDVFVYHCVACVACVARVACAGRGASCAQSRHDLRIVVGVPERHSEISRPLTVVDSTYCRTLRVAEKFGFVPEEQVDERRVVETVAGRRFSGMASWLSMVRYEMQRRASSWRGPTMAWVGQTLMHATQRPQ